MCVKKLVDPRWDENEKCWIKQVRRNGQVKKFRSYTKGTAGKNEVKRLVKGFLEDREDKFNWPVDRCYALFLDDVATRLGKDLETYIQHAKHGRLYILPVLGLYRIGQVTEQDWQNVIYQAKPTKKSAKTKELLRTQLSKKTLANIRGSITTFCRFAKKNRMIDEDQIPSDIEIPKNAPKIGRKVMNKADLVLLWIYDDWYKHAWLLMALAGLRPGEVYGLKKCDVKGSWLTVSRAINRLRKVTDGKNENAQRPMKLTKNATRVIDKQRAQIEQLQTDWLFPDPEGHQIKPHRSYKHFDSFRKAHNLSVSPQGLRHTFVSFGKKKIPEGMLQQYCGHSEDMDTFGVYGHELEDDMDETVKYLDDIFSFLDDEKLA